MYTVARTGGLKGTRMHIIRKETAHEASMPHELFLFREILCRFTPENPSEQQLTFMVIEW